MLTAAEQTEIREQFPILKQQVHGSQLVYLDNAATAQKPQRVIDALGSYYSSINSNVHRGVHHLSQRATDAFEQSREAVRAHLNAAETAEIIFTKGTTDSINLVASGYREQILQPGDVVVVSELEHHSNLVPWQIAAERSGAQLRIIPMNEDGTLNLETLPELLAGPVKLVAVNHISNALGTINPIEKIIAAAHEAGAHVLIDGAQSVPHLQVDVRALDADFYTFSGHKTYGPTGVGVLYGKRELLEMLPPYQGGGEMIADVSLEKSTYAEIPHKFEAGTPNIADVIALHEAIRFMNDVGVAQIAAWEHTLLEAATQQLSAIAGLRIYGTAPEKASVVSFLVDGVHPYDLGVLLDQMGIAVRTGHHCTQPIMNKYQIPGTARASMAVYNTLEEVERLAQGVSRAVKMLV